MSVANDSRETSQLSALQEHIDADHETLRALWKLAAHWDTEAEAAEKFHIHVNGGGAEALNSARRARARTLRSCAAELRDVAAGRQT